MRKQLPLLLLCVQAVLWFVIFSQAGNWTNANGCSQFPCIFQEPDPLCLDPMCPYIQKFTEWVGSRPFPINVGIVLLVPGTLTAFLLAANQFHRDDDDGAGQSVKGT